MGGASRILLVKFVSMWAVCLGLTELCKGFWNPGPQNPKSSTMKTTTWHSPNSGKEKAHKHKQIFPVTARAGGGSPDRVGGGVSRPVARGQKLM